MVEDQFSVELLFICQKFWLGSCLDSGVQQSYIAGEAGWIQLRFVECNETTQYLYSFEMERLWQSQ